MKLLLTAVAVLFANPNLVAPVRFPAIPGWHTGTAQAQACPGGSSTRCTQAWSWSGTIRWKDCRNCTPHKTLRSLPPDGILFAASRVRERPVVAKREIRWPPHISASQVTAGMEGIPSRYGVYQLFARLPNRDTILLWAYFGRGHPSKPQLAAANAQLQRARLP